jgi:hypothetical protein
VRISVLPYMFLLVVLSEIILAFCKTPARSDLIAYTAFLALRFLVS